MRKYIIKRILTLIPVLLIVSLLVFMMVHLMPGDPAEIVAGQTATEQDIQNVRRAMGLDKPLYQQYFIYLANILRGDMGTSIRTGRPVIEEVSSRFPFTFKLAVAATIIATLIGILAGVISATKKYSVFDNVTMFVALIGISVPPFYLGLMLMLYFSVKLNWVPLFTYTGIIALILPAIALSFRSLAIIARMTRSSMLEVMNQDYILTARAQGFSENRVIYGHALKNALNSIITVAGLQFGHLLGGAVVTEKVFAWPGIGQLLIDGINGMDFPIVQACVLIVATSFVLINLLVDILYAIINPRIKYS